MAATEPILIVGAGPTGLVLAIELSRRRIPVRLIDRKPEPTRTSRSFTLHARTMEMFEQMGIAERFLADGIRSRGFYFNFRGKDAHPTRDFSDIASRYNYVLVYNQNDTERRLREHLDATYDIRPEWGKEIVALSEDREGFAVTLNDQQQATAEDCHPQWIVGRDGVHSFVRRARDLEFEGENYDGMIMQMMDVELSSFEGGDDWVHYYMSKSNFLLVTKLPGRNHRVLISDMGEADRDDVAPREAFQELIDEHVDGVTIADPEWATKWVIWKRLASGYRKGRTLLAGDAAHVHSPSGGQGMNIGMQDAYNLAWKLAFVVRGLAREELLDTYENERQPIGAQAIAGTDAMHDIIMAHGHGMEDRLRLTQQPGWHDEAVNRISGLSYSYRAVAGSASDPEPGHSTPGGDRLPGAELEHGYRLHRLLAHPRYTLLLAPAAGADANPDADARPRAEATPEAALELGRYAAGRYGQAVQVAAVVPQASASRFSDFPGAVVADPSGHASAQLGSGPDGAACLVRPDGYVAERSTLLQRQPVIDYLERWLV